MKKLSLLFVLVAVMLASCSPKVTVNLIESLPARQVDSVIVYEQNEPLPAGARKIGTVKATDPGFTPTENCMYSNMLSLAVRKTAECGGTALHVDEHNRHSHMYHQGDDSRKTVEHLGFPELLQML